MKKWLLWDGRRWIIDEMCRAQEHAVSAMRMYVKQVETRQFTDDKLHAFAIKSLNAQSIANALKLASSKRTVTTEALDEDPWALNCLNGTVDLRTSTLTPHDRTQLITKLVHYDYIPLTDPAVQCPAWMEFLYWAMCRGPEPGDEERAERLVRYIQRALGYSLTGITINKAVFIPLGELGNNGKSTMLDIVRKIISEYSALLDVETLMVRQATNNMQADLADLRGARFVQTSETEESQRLSQSTLKKLTAGMGMVKACRKFENPITFQANFHIWIDTNKMPHLADPDDKATLDRLHLIPFKAVIKGQPDFTLSSRLLAEAPGILAWMIAGAQEWSADGLSKPPEITEARDEWQATLSDPRSPTIEAWLQRSCDEYQQKWNGLAYFTCSIPEILERALAVKVKDMTPGSGSNSGIGRILKRLGWVVDHQAGLSKVRMYRKGTDTY